MTKSSKINLNNVPDWYKEAVALAADNAKATLVARAARVTRAAYAADEIVRLEREFYSVAPAANTMADYFRSKIL